MSILRVFKYLVMGVVVGAVLFFAGFGVLKLVDKNAESEVVQNPNAAQEPSPAELTPPTITVNSSADPAEIIDDVNDASNPIKIKPLDGDDQNADTAATDDADAVAFGQLTLRTVTAATNEPVNADFLIQNSESAVIALVKKTASTTLSLPVGNYKITVTQADQKVVRFLGVREGQQGAEVFELDLSDEVAKANTPAAGSVPLIADETTSVTETSTSQTSELIDEVTPPITVEGSDETTTTVSETSTDVTTVETDATQTEMAGTETTETEATIDDEGTTVTATAEQSVGGLRVSALTEGGKRPVKASFYIQRLNGENVDNKKNVETQQFSLPAGRYRVTARTPDVRLVEDLEVLAGKGLHQIFLIPEPETASAPEPRAPTPAAPETPVRVEVPTPAPAAPQASTTVEPTPAPSSSEPASDGQTGRLELFAQHALNQSAVKSNFYVQTPDGKLVTNKTYVDSIGYKLPVGQYRVTVRATGFLDKTVDVRVRGGQTRREVFKLESVESASQAAPVQTQIPVIPPAPIVVQPPVVVPAAPQVQQQTNPANPNNRGGLQVNIISARDGSGLIADIAVVNGNGRVIRRADGVSTANFDLPAREFMVRVIYGGLITNEKVMIQSRKIAIKTIRFSDRPSRQQREERGVRQ